MRTLLFLAAAIVLGSGAFACAPTGDDKPASLPDGHAGMDTTLPDARSPDARSYDARSPDARSPDAQPDAGVAALLAPFCEGASFVPREGPLERHADLVAFINSLPRPLTLPCFLAALPRPLGIAATASIISLQPANGRMSPRIFFRTGSDRLITSVSLVGDQSSHIETAEPEEVGFSVKGDLAFPLTERVVERQFFAGILKPSGTICNGCHGDERLVRLVDGVPAYASRAFRPAPSQDVSLQAVRGLAAECLVADTGRRCQMLRALFRDPAAVTGMDFLEGSDTWGLR